MAKVKQGASATRRERRSEATRAPAKRSPTTKRKPTEKTTKRVKAEKAAPRSEVASKKTLAKIKIPASKLRSATDAGIDAKRRGSAKGKKPIADQAITDKKPMTENKSVKVIVKDKGAGAKAPGAKTPAKEAVGASGAKAGKSGKSGAATKAGSKAKAGAAKPPEVVVPARKIQVMQLSTLKAGARGSKAPQVRTDVIEDDKEPVEGTAKKRRSAELTTPQLDHFRDLLVQRRSRLSSDLTMMQDEALKVTAQDNSSDSVADTGTDNYEQDFTLGLIESEEMLAREVGDAIVRCEQGTFGVCEGCQTPIPLARLEILPFARFCIGCQQKREGRT